jgi:hypothetical protein
MVPKRPEMAILPMESYYGAKPDPFATNETVSNFYSLLTCSDRNSVLKLTKSKKRCLGTLMRLSRDRTGAI